MDSTPVAAAREPLPPSISAVPAVDDGNDSEWEYEYSSTETETHLITLDLSMPEFLRRRDNYVVHNTRGGFRSWMNPLLAGDDEHFEYQGADHRRLKGSSTAARHHGLRNENAAADDNSEAEGGGSTGRYLTKPTSAAFDGRNGEDANNKRDDDDGDGDAEPAKIQVLELHSDQPILSYRGTVFAGVWTESVGTEMIFADAKSTKTAAAALLSSLPLPYVRRLPQDVDLLGASTARIACTPVELRRRQQHPRYQQDRVVGGPIVRRRQFAIPVAGGATEQRQRQAAFLERLMAAKHGRGERDVVTVQAVETRQDSVQDDTEEERLRRKKAAQFERYRLRASRRRRGEGDAGVGREIVEVRDAAEAGKETATVRSITSAAPAAPAPGPKTRATARSRKKPRSSMARVTGDARDYEEDRGSGTRE